MANRRLWMFNPGGAPLPCCDAGEETPCTSLCVTVTDGGTADPIAGAVLVLLGDDVELDTCTTDAAGECCLNIPTAEGPVVYTLTSEATGYLGESVVLTLTGGDAEGVCTAAVTLDVNPYCLTVLIWNCGCPTPGLTATWTQGGYTATGITGADGIATLCFTEAAWTDATSNTLTLSGTGYVTQVITMADAPADSGPFPLFYVILLVDADQRFCEHNLPEECTEYTPATLTVTLSGTWPVVPVGTPVTVYRLSDPLGTPYQYDSGCLDGTGFAAKYRIIVELNGGTVACGERHHATAIVFAGTGINADCSNLVAVGTEYGCSVLGSNPSYSTSCPISFTCDADGSGGTKHITVSE